METDDTGARVGGTPMQVARMAGHVGTAAAMDVMSCLLAEDVVAKVPRWNARVGGGLVGR